MMVENEKNYVCPLLENPSTYNPDTIDLFNNEKERNYWLPCLDHMVKKFVSRASSLNPDNPLATEKAEVAYQQFHNLVQNLIKNPSILKPLSVRTLLNVNENNLRTNNFKDAWYLQKKMESSQALFEFKDRIEEIDSIGKFEDKWLELSKGVLAGNVFDWGSIAVANILEHTNNFGLSQAMSIIEKRPWFRDDFDKWIKYIKKQPYKTVVIFVDNAGVDFVLGILPLVREFLANGTKVILTANSLPALNDVTYDELNIYCCGAAQYCDIIKDAIDTGRLITVENGQKGPCLDLTDLSKELCNLMTTADLIIIEGMGRAVHTNLFAKFKIDSIKMAVLKNEWLAQSLGAKQFSVIFNYESASS